MTHADIDDEHDKKSYAVIAADLRKVADDAWEKGLKELSTRLHFIASEVAKL